MKWIAHRGASHEKPENTLAAFIQAIELKADFLECDVHLSSDGFPVVMHDAVEDMTLAGLRERGVPLLEEVLALNHPVMIEIKPWDLLLVHEVINLTLEKKVVVGSFDKRVLRALKLGAPHLPLIEIVESFEECQIFPSYVALRGDRVKKEEIQALKAKGCEVWAWTIDTLKEARVLISQGIEGIITNDVRKLLTLSEPKQFASVYRFQFTASFTFRMAKELIPYLKKMGIEAVYCSPCLQATLGSPHGYDVIDAHCLNRELGTFKDFQAFSEALKKEGIGLFFDLVANHTAGEKYKGYFDVMGDFGCRYFLEIEELKALAMEKEEVFEGYLSFVFELILEGYIDGLRIDYPDGFLDPAGFFKKIKTLFPYLYVVVEKILGKGETLPEEWGVEGTVGYEYLNALTGIFVDPEGEATLTELSNMKDPEAGLVLAKTQFINTYFQKEFNYLLSLRPGLSHEELLERLTTLKVYRTYEPSTDLFTLRFQQLSPVVMIKGVEDTFFYRYDRLLALNEVGGNPLIFGTSLEEFHALNHSRGFITANTHDTKRSEDARMRLTLLSELSQEWKEVVGELSYPMEYFVCQTLLSVYEEGKEEEIKKRLKAYLIKAAREAKEETAWDSISESYEEEVLKGLEALFLKPSFFAFWQKIDRLGKLNSLSALVLRLGSPGIFDLYQGREWFCYSLVDPDNRTPVDYEAEPDEKHRMMERGLNYRLEHKELFLEGEYIPLDVDRGVAFMRQWRHEGVIVVAKVFHSKEDEAALFLPYPMHLRNIFTQQEIFVKSVLKEPLAAIYEIL